MLLKKITKFVSYFFLLLGVIYLGIVFSFGGFGNKSSEQVGDADPNTPLLFAHRGIAVYYPENSLQGIKAAKDLGFKAVEVDIRRTADNQNIAFHDDNAKRILGIDKPVDKMSYDQLMENTLILRNCTRSDVHISKIEEFLNSQKQDLIFYFDLKFSSFDEADEMVNLIKKYKCEKTVILMNWDISFIFYVEANYPEIITGLEGFDAGKEWIYTIIPKNLKPDFLSGFYSNTNEEHIKWLKENELMNSKIVYGVDSLNYKEALKSGFKNIIIDYDTLMRKDPKVIDLLHT